MTDACYHMSAYYRARAARCDALGYTHAVRFYRARAVKYLLIACRDQSSGDGFEIPHMYRG